MGRHVWLAKRLTVFVMSSIPFFVFYCYANDRHRAAISFGFTIWSVTFGLFTYLSQLQTKRLEKSEGFFNRLRTEAGLKDGGLNLIKL
jgi:hypothetical protein